MSALNLVSLMESVKDFFFHPIFWGLGCLMVLVAWLEKWWQVFFTECFWSFGIRNRWKILFQNADLQRLFRWWPALLRLWGQFDACKSYQLILSEDRKKDFLAQKKICGLISRFPFSATTTQLSSYFVSEWMTELFMKTCSILPC